MQRTVPAPPPPVHAVVSVPAEVTQPTASASEGERRQVTVMFLDLAGSTRLAEHLDPEDLRDVLRSYQEVCATVVKRFEGTIAKYIGDGMLVYFGYPVAHEDDAIRAAHAGLGILDGLNKLNVRLNQERGLLLEVRIGIHTGLVVAGEMGAGDVRETHAIVGETPNIAARVESAARGNSVTISDSTLRLIEEAFVCKSVGQRPLKGVTRPVELFEIEAQRKFEDLATDRPLIGREHELGMLLERWRQAKEGTGRTTLITAEAGVGKSRLLQVFREKVAPDDHTRLEARCSAYSQTSALHPVIDMIEKELGFQTIVSPNDRLTVLEMTLTALGLPLDEIVPPIANLLSLSTFGKYPPLNLGPIRLKQTTLEAMMQVLVGLAERRPVLFVIEDLHWADPSTLELCEMLVEQGHTGPIFTILTYRPQFQAPWPPRSTMSQIVLENLGKEHTHALIASVSGKPLPGEVVKHIVEKADGVPLFVEQMTRTIIESGILTDGVDGYELTGSLDAVSIPSSLQDSLMARLDRLSTIKEVIQIGATLGREFSFELLQAVAPIEAEVLKRELARLVESDLLQQRGIPPRSRYIFKHALIQDAAYEALLKSRRSGYHQTIAQVLVERFPDVAETQPELVAHHYTAARQIPEALEFWFKAGQRAIQRSSFAEAILHLNKAISIVATLPEEPATWGREIMFQTMLGIPLMMTRGYASPEMERAYTRAHELSQRLGDAPQMFPALYGLWLYYQVRAQMVEAQETAERLLAIANGVGDSGLQVESYAALGSTYMCRGKFADARKQFEAGLALYDPVAHAHHAAQFGQDPGVVCGAHLAWVLWILGDPQAAQVQMDASLDLARSTRHFHSIAFAYDFSAALAMFRRMPEKALELANETIVLSGEQGFPFWLAGGMTYAGWASGQLGRADEGLGRLAQGHDAWEMTGASLMRPCYLALRAETLLAAGQPDEAIKAVDEGLLASARGESWYEAELHRLRGVALMQRDGTESDESRASLERAVAVGQEQGATNFVLRAEATMRGEQVGEFEARSFLK